MRNGSEVPERAHGVGVTGPHVGESSRRQDRYVSDLVRCSLRFDEKECSEWNDENKVECGEWNDDNKIENRFWQ